MSRLLLACGLGLTAAAPPRIILNVIFDDLGWANVGWRSPNLPESATPRLAELALEGIVFDRQYNHFTCTPSRSSFMSGRLPMHVQSTLANPDVQNAGLPVNMTTIVEKLALANYTTRVIAGKWDLGVSTPHHTPEGRGYSSSLVYFEHMNNYWSMRIEPTGTSCTNSSIQDLWEDGKPARTLASEGRYIEELFFERAMAVIDDIDPQAEDRIFLDVHTHSMHWPLMVPQADYDAHAWVMDDEGACAYRFYGDQPWPGANVTFACRRLFQAMLNATDSKIGRLADALKAKGVWGDTLMSVMSDNGGSNGLSESAGNNWPNRGGKYTPFEGGCRVNAFVSGGYLPQTVRGTTSSALIHIADYFKTMCLVAGLSEEECERDDKAAGAVPPLPPIDSHSFLPVLMGTGTLSLRTEVPVSRDVLLTTPAAAGAGTPGGPWWKVMRGSVNGAGRGAPVFPNSTSPDPMTPSLNCTHGCLFDVWDDETETNDVAAAHPALVASMLARLDVLAKSFYSNSDVGADVCPGKEEPNCACWAAEHVWGGFLGPYQE
jgi:arylsulfatase B